MTTPDSNPPATAPGLPGLPELPDRLLARLRDPASKILILTGAGISVAANLPTYRGDGGLYPTGTLIPLTAAQAYSKTVHQLWRTISPLTAAAAHAAPTAAHAALTAAQTAGRPVTVITQNVDGLHAAAGTEVIELHGNLARARCLNPKCKIVRPSPPGHDPDGPDDVARCTDYTGPDGITHEGCRARLRPDAVLFGEMLAAADIRAARNAAGQADVVLAVGTSLQVQPAAGFVMSALGSGALGAWLELDPVTMLAEVDITDRYAIAMLTPVPGDCQVTLPALLALAGT